MPLANDLGIDDVLAVLEDQFQLPGEIRGNEYLISCPNPDHDDHNPSCSVNLKTGLFHCFSCNISGDLLKLGHLILGWAYDEVEKSLQPDNPQSILNQIAIKIREGKKKANVKPTIVSDFPPYYSREPLDFMRKRGFTDDTLNRWGIQFVPEETLIKGDKKIYLRNCIAIPLYNYRELLCGWIYRKTDDSIPKYVYTPHFPISDFWFGCNRMDGNSPIIVEGSLDVMWLDQAGLFALGMLGSNADNKLSFLWQFPRVYLFPDRDKAGVTWMQNIAPKLSRYCQVFIMKYPKASKYKDPQEVPHKIIIKMLANAEPWIFFEKRLRSKQ